MLIECLIARHWTFVCICSPSQHPLSLLFLRMTIFLWKYNNFSIPRKIKIHLKLSQNYNNLPLYQFVRKVYVALGRFDWWSSLCKRLHHFHAFSFFNRSCLIAKRTWSYSILICFYCTYNFLYVILMDAKRKKFDG